MAKPKLPNVDSVVAIDQRPRFAMGATLFLVGFLATDGAKLPAARRDRRARRCRQPDAASRRRLVPLRSAAAADGVAPAAVAFRLFRR